MIRINLLTEGRKPVAVRPVQAAAPTSSTEALGKWSLLGLILVGLLVSAGYYFFVHRNVVERQEEVNRAQKEVTELEPIIKEVEEFKARQLELQRRVKVINDLKAAQSGPVQIMDQISRAIPDLLWLNRMDVGRRNITLTGSAFNTNAVANLLENLDNPAA